MAEHIEREALKRAIRKAFHDLGVRIDINSVINAQPTADVVEVKHGKWIREQNCFYRCSLCGKHYASIQDKMQYNYCPNCGAKMDERGGR